MEQTFLWCPIEQELLENIDPHPCEYCGDGCVHCPHLMEIDEYWQEVRG